MRVFGNRVLSRIFGQKKIAVAGCMRELHNLYSSPSIFGMIKPRRIRWAG
jgi:hypothetical protein